jgi:pyridoxine 4-dehydrogenase
VPMEDQLAVLADMQVEGKIHHIGLSKVDVDQIRKASELLDVAAVQNKYSISNRKFEEVLHFCEINNIAFIPYAPLASGRLAETNGVLDELSETYGATPAQLAIAWLLHHSPVIMPIPGASSSAHLRENLAAADVELSPEDVMMISLKVHDRVTATET